MDTSVVDKVVEELNTLPRDLQRRVLEYARRLGRSSLHGVPGRRLLSFAGTIPPDDLHLMQEAIEKGCEQVDASEGVQSLPALAQARKGIRCS